MENFTIYDMNKQVCAQLPELTESETENAKSLIASFIDFHKRNSDEKYYMLLNHEVRYFTLFHDLNWSEPKEIAEQIYEIAVDLGKVKSVQYMDKTNSAIEIWVDDKMYLLFPYTRGVVEI